MRALSRFESFVEALMEGPFARLPGGRIQPVQMAKQIEREMDLNRSVGPSKLFVPNRFTVYLHPNDYAEIAAAAPALGRELASYADELAAERGYSFLGPVSVTLAADPSMSPRQTRVESASSSWPTSGEASPADVADLERTQALPTVLPTTGPPPTGAHLVVKDGETGRIFPIDRQVTSIGRALDNDLVIEQSGVSRRHAELRYDGDRFWLVDLRSTNGTRVNAVPAQTRQLMDGDRLEIGGVEMVVRLPSSRGR